MIVRLLFVSCVWVLIVVVALGCLAGVFAILDLEFVDCGLLILFALWTDVAAGL